MDLPEHLASTSTAAIADKRDGSISVWDYGTGHRLPDSLPEEMQ